MEKEELKNIIKEVVRQELADMVGPDRFRFNKNIQIENGRNIEFSKVTGTKIGGAATQKLSFYGVTPVDQPATISDPAGAGSAGVDQPARDAINTIIDRLQELGLIA
jgi:hypothetical protein